MTLLQRLQSRHADGLGVTETEVMRILQRSTQWGWAQWQDWLLTQHFMVRTADGDFRLARDLSQVDIAELLPTLPWSLPVSAELAADSAHDAAQPWLPALRHWLQPVQHACQRPQALHQLLNGEIK